MSSTQRTSLTDLFFDIYFSGLRKVYPYPYTFSTYAKERWYGRTIQDIFENEFRVDSPDNFVSIPSPGGGEGVGRGGAVGGRQK